AIVSMGVISPNGTLTSLSTGNGITANQECGLYNAQYGVTVTGNYTVNVSATANGINTSFTTSFLVQNYIPFDIIRTAQSKIDPVNNPNLFNVKIDVASYTNASSVTIQEQVPSVFNVTTDGTVSTSGDTKIISWNKGLVGSKTSVQYSYSVPLVFPQLYALGPSQISYGNSTFTEARQWYVANDPVQPTKVGSVISEGTSGTATSSSFTTTGTLPAGNNLLYVVGVTINANRSPSVSDNGPGLTWTLQKNQCGGRGGSSATIFTAYGSSASAFTITVSVGTASRLAIVGTAFRNADPTTNIESVHGDNSRGLDGSCSGGTNNKAMHQTSLISTNARSQYVVVAATLSSTISTFPVNYTQLTTYAGASSNIAYLVNSTLSSAGTNDFWSTLSGNTDWSTAGLVIVPLTHTDNTDSLSLADSITKQTTKTKSDSLSLADPAVSTTRSRVVSVSDSLSLADSITKQTTKTKSDSLSLADSITKQTTKTKSDSLSLADPAVSTTRSRVASISDSVPITDPAVSTTRSRIVSVSDSLSLSDTISSPRSLLHSASDSVSLSDSLAKTQSTSVSVSDSLSLSDAITTPRTLVRSLSDSVPITDPAVSVTRSRSVLLSDNLSVSDTISSPRSLLHSASDSVSLSDSLAKTQSTSVSVSDSLSLSDAITTPRTLVRSLSDSVPITDPAVSVTRSRSVLLSDNLSVSDTISSPRSLLHSASDSVSLSDSLAKTQSTSVSVSDSLSLSDAITTPRTLVRSLSDSVPITDPAVSVTRSRS